MKYEEMDKNKNVSLLCSQCLWKLFCIIKPTWKQQDGEQSNHLHLSCQCAQKKMKKLIGC